MLFGDLLCGHVVFGLNMSAEYGLGIDIQVSRGWSALVCFLRDG